MAFPHLSTLSFSLQLFHTVPTICSVHLQPQPHCCWAQRANPTASSCSAFPSSSLVHHHLCASPCYLLICLCVLSDSGPFLPFFCDYIPVPACKRLNNLTGVSAMNSPVTKSVNVPSDATPPTCYHHLFACRSSHSVLLSFPPTLTFPPHTHLLSFLQSMARFSIWVYITA